MYQQIMLVGSLSGDPKMRLTQDGTPVTSFRVVTNRSWRAQDGTTQNKTVRFDVSARGRLAEVVNQYMTNGQRVLVVGELEEPSTWTDGQGNTRASLEVQARNVQFLTSRTEAQPFKPAPSQLGHDWQCKTSPREWNDGEGFTNMERCSKCKKRRYVDISRSKQAILRIQYVDNEENLTEKEPPCIGTSLVA
ncbi:MAG: single-stranded DNA-binding protein [Caldilineaceae bacterium SB0670_bin_27]|uniref:Single-stranded DNA-binding protein n=1 Tax=Caldilineaceae bacterium SB0664_bin_27 TaxID=2605260 RepID=A0A6B0YMU2_9CHLR|nr:single-stranded DNA-binding protein [Caldilineaceae bacterium SB0664_bin_27]MYJ78845.1 single-stranded DNA-binding protein [Caldilineaceae bacterium SB0670_bin_27]